MFRKHPTAMAVTLVAAHFGALAQAQAQSDAMDSAQTLQAISVTAQQGATKSLTPIVETPQSVTVIGREQMQEQGAMTVQQATGYTAGVFNNQTGASNRFDYLVLRGFSDGSLGNTYLNGLRLLGDTNSHSSLVVDPWFLDNIEVIRGPASVLYGQSSPGGIVAMQTRKAGFSASREVEAGLGNNDQAYAAFDFNQPVSDSLALRLSGKVRRADSQVDQVEEERYALMPSLTWKIGPSTTLEAMAYLHRDPEGGYHSGLPYEGTVVDYNGRKLSRGFFSGEKDYEKYRRDEDIVGYALSHHFNDTVSFRQNLQYLESDVKLDQVYGFGWVSPTELVRYYSGSDEDLSAFTVDNQLEFRFDTGTVGHTLLTGVDYQWRENDVSWPSGAFPNIDAFDPVYGAGPTAMYPPTRENHKLKQTGVYVQDLMAWNRWRLSLGGRYDRIDIRSVNKDSGIASEIDDSQFSSRAGLLYLFDSGFAPYASYSTAFTPTNFLDADGNLLQPMEGEQVEAGVKYQRPGTRSSYSAAVYHITQKNVATKNQPTDPYRAVGEIESKGFELEAHAWLTDRLSLLASYSYNDIRYSRSDDGNQGNRAVYAPKHMASAWVSYRHMGRLRGLTTALGVRYADGIQSDRANTHTLPSYTLVDLAVGYDLGEVGIPGLSTRLNVQNVMDKKYVAACNSLEFCYYGAERNVMLNVNYKF